MTSLKDLQMYLTIALNGKEFKELRQDLSKDQAESLVTRWKDSYETVVSTDYSGKISIAYKKGVEQEGAQKFILEQSIKVGLKMARNPRMAAAVRKMMRPKK